MRITFNSTYATASQDLARTALELANRQREVSSGRRLNVPSDDPSAASATVTEHGEVGAIDAFSEASDSANSRLSVLDTLMSDVVDKLTSAKVQALAARGSSVTDAQREATANELGGLRDAVFSDFNTSFRGTYLFSGTSALDPAYTRLPDGSVSAYQGDANGMQVDIDRGVAVQVTYSAADVAQGSDAQDLFTSFDQLIAAVRSGDDAGIASGTDAISRAFDRATTTQTKVGTELNAIESQQGKLDALRQESNARISKLESADMADAISRMTQADTAYRAALGAVARLNGLSLMDYLK